MHNFAIEQLNSNDDEYTLTKYLVLDNEFVKKSQSFVEIETSKVSVTLDAPCDGYIKINVKENETMKVGDIICSFSKDKSQDTKNITNDINQKNNLNDQKNSKSEEFKVNRPYKKLKENSNKEVNNYLGTTLPKDPRKAAESKNLLEVNSSNLISCLQKEIMIGERIEKQDDLFENNISDLIIYEISQLTKKYKKINSYLQSNGELKIYEYLNFGYTVDVEDKLTVVNLGETNKSDIKLIREKINDAIVSATLNKFNADQSKNATITLSDLSSNTLVGFYPLIPAKSSCTIGLSKSTKTKYIISFSFDHRIIGGQYASNFLDELEKKILKYFNIIKNFENTQDLSIQQNNECFYCGKDREASKLLQEKGFLKVVTPEGNEELCCRVCFEGW